MAQYSTGSVAVTNASQTVYGTGTAWLSNTTVGAIFIRTGDSVPYVVASIVGDSQITLSTPYQGATATGQAYTLDDDFTANYSLPLFGANALNTPILHRRAMAIIDVAIADLSTDISDLGINFLAYTYGVKPSATAAENMIALQTALTAVAAAGGGTLWLPIGNLKFARGTGSLLSDTLSTGNIIIRGYGSATVLDLYNGSSAQPDNTGNEFYNLFQATGLSNITIRDLHVKGYGALAYFDSCTNVKILNVTGNGLGNGAGGYLFNKCIYTKTCTNVEIAGCSLYNYYFHAYLSGTSGNLTDSANVHDCFFTNNTAAGSFTGLYPVGVYVHYANAKISRCWFTDIYSDLDAGDTGSGMGYGVYEGDGECKYVEVEDCHFTFNGNGSKYAMGVYTNQAERVTITNPHIYNAAAGNCVAGIRTNFNTTAAPISVEGGKIISAQTGFTHYAIWGVGVSDTDTTAANFSVSGKTVIRGWSNNIRVDNGGRTSFYFEGVDGETAIGAGVQMTFGATVPNNRPVFRACKFNKSGTNAFLFNAHVISPALIDCEMFDGNTTGATSDSGAAIRFTSNSFGCFIDGCRGGNTPEGGGQFTMIAAQAANNGSRMFKDIITESNTWYGEFSGGGIYAGSGGANAWLVAAPTNPTLDIVQMDMLKRTNLTAGGNPGDVCVFAKKQLLTADASNASTTITVASTSSMAAGDLVLITKKKNMAQDASYYTTTDWHISTIDSITDGTHFVLTTGIPAGDGTYVSGTGYVVVARYKALAAIAA